MPGDKYINTNPETKSQLSREAFSLLLPLMLLSNFKNHINKKQFIASVGWITDHRTWQKYWSELEDNNIIICLDKKIWMVSPHECYAVAAIHSELINKWNEARNAATATK
jgi:hypothetical protein